MDIADLTIGIEEEYQIIDPETRELTSYIGEFLEGSPVVFRDQVKPEFLQSQIETGSHVCRNIQEARQEVVRLRGLVAEIAERHDRKIVAAGTHPFSRWEDQLITNTDRYQGLVDDMQYVARRLLVFGLHIHIGIPDRELRVDVMNQMIYFLPHILSLSTSSPFWLGTNTGLKSYRSIVFDDLPRTGLPEYFNSAAEYDQFVDMLTKTRCIDEPGKIWWDIRLNPRFPTLELRICDCTTKVSDVIAITALVQAVAAKLILFRQSNQTWRKYRRALVEENKWRAVRDGVEGKLLDWGKQREVPMRALTEELIELLGSVLDELGTREEVEHIHEILDKGTSADRQLSVYEETKDLRAVVDKLAEETLMGV